MSKTLISVAALAMALAAGAAFAADGKTTAEIRKEGAEAARSGQGKGEYDCPDTSKVKSTRSRAEVRAEGAAAARSPAGKGEADCADTANTKSTRTRAEVKAEAKAANKAGTVGKGEN